MVPPQPLIGPNSHSGVQRSSLSYSLCSFPHDSTPPNHPCPQPSPSPVQPTQSGATWLFRGLRHLERFHLRMERITGHL